jgi:hypothetical protein
MRTLLLGVVHSQGKEASAKSGPGAKGRGALSRPLDKYQCILGKRGKVEINQVLTPSPLCSSAFDRLVRSERLLFCTVMERSADSDVMYQDGDILCQTEWCSCEGQLL